MSRTLLYLLLLFALGLLAFWAVNNYSSSSSTVNKAETSFAVKDTAAISKIEIKNGQNGKRITLERQTGGNWRLNQYYNASSPLVDNLLTTICQLRMQRPVSNAAYDNVMQSFEKPKKTVKIYTTDPNVPSKEYHLGDILNSKKGTYVMMEGFERPYVVGVPGIKGHLHPRFSTELPSWRNRIIFNYHYNDIAKIKVEYHLAPENSYEMEVVSKKEILVKPLGNNTVPKGDKVNMPVAMRYLNSFQKMHAEAFENTHPNIDSLKASKPFCTYTVTNKKGKSKSMVMHYMPINKRSKSQIDRDGKAVPYDPDRFFVFTNKGNDLLIIQRFVFGKIMKGLPDFYY